MDAGEGEEERPLAAVFSVSPRTEKYATPSTRPVDAELANITQATLAWAPTPSAFAKSAERVFLQ